jgi:hypothetical protein
MPASSAEKRARQRANKLKSTQTPEIVPLPAQSTDSTSAPHPLAPPSTVINFETFVELANLDDVLRFCDTAASLTREGRNLKLLWDRAFEAGLNQGRSEERDYRDEMYLQGKAQGIKQAEEAASQAEIDLYRHGIVKGGIDERSKWTSSGHGPHCLTPAAILSDASIQTDSEPSITATCDAGIQVDLATPAISLNASVQALEESEPPPPPSQPQKMITVPFNWAEDSNSLLITPLPPLLRQPRDLSVLRSSSSSPFSSLQHRSKRFSHQSRRRHSHSHFNSLHRTSFKPFQTHSHLNWESDPRLSDLSRSLKALGWIRAS